MIYLKDDLKEEPVLFSHETVKRHSWRQDANIKSSNNLRLLQIQVHHSKERRLKHQEQGVHSVHGCVCVPWQTVVS